jgi:hypothetical protein
MVVCAHRITERRVRKARGAAIYGVLSLLAASQVGCAAKSQVSAPPPRGQAYRLSEKAQKVAGLIDQGSFGAAEQLFRSYLASDPGDAGLYCQYARYLILSCNPAYPGFVQSPLRSDGGYYLATGVVDNALQAAVQLDPKCAPYLTDTVLRSFEQIARQQLREGSACVGAGKLLHNFSTGDDFYAEGTEISMLNVCFEAAKTDPATARSWGPTFETLTRAYAEAGKCATAMMMGNLTGELIQVRDDGAMKGPEDFKRANAAFLEALKNARGEDVRTWAKMAAEAYPGCFQEEMTELERGGNPDPGFAVLEAALAKLDVRIPRAIPEPLATGGAPPQRLDK